MKTTLRVLAAIVLFPIWLPFAAIGVFIFVFVAAVSLIGMMLCFIVEGKWTWDWVWDR